MRRYHTYPPHEPPKSCISICETPNGAVSAYVKFNSCVVVHVVLFTAGMVIRGHPHAECFSIT